MISRTLSLFFQGCLVAAAAAAWRLPPIITRMSRLDFPKVLEETPSLLGNTINQSILIENAIGEARDICCITINDIVSKIRRRSLVVALVHQGDEITNLYMTCHGEGPSKQASIVTLTTCNRKALGLVGWFPVSNQEALVMIFTRRLQTAYWLCKQ